MKGSVCVVSAGCVGGKIDPSASVSIADAEKKNSTDSLK